ncbi:MAG: NAD(P)-dependent alcohol dehydrogenase, partial [Achromobacter sp.]|nr:NAD(P)-dependent alcohol dehydrogenase [Achromobacter sp.]
MPVMMKAAVFVEPGRIEIVDKPIPDVGPNDALIRITTTTICGTDIHILKGEYPVAPGLTVGHEPVGIIEKLGSAVTGYQEGQRVIAGAICPNFNSYAAQDGVASQDGSYLAAMGLCGCHGYQATAGWRFGNKIDGTQAELVRVPYADNSTHRIPDGVSDEQMLMLADILPTSYEVGVLNGRLRPADVVVIIGAGPIGLAAILAARLFSPSRIVAVDLADSRLDAAKAFGANIVVNSGRDDVATVVRDLTGGLGADVT